MFPFSLELGLTCFWYPYFMYGKYEEPWQAEYYGHEWFLLISIFVIEITILRKLNVTEVNNAKSLPYQNR